MDFVVLFLVITAAIIGSSIVVGFIGYGTIKALARNPSSAPVLLIGMIVMLIFNEGIIVVSLLVFFQIFIKL